MMRSTALEDEIESLLKANAILTVGSNEAAVAINGIAGRMNLRARVHIKIDTGMGRYGFEPGEFEKISAIFTYMPNIEVCGMYTHLNAAFGNKKKTLGQIAAFHAVVAKTREQGFEPGMVHFANSSALFKLRGVELDDGVRIGSAFTGRLAFACKDSGLRKVGYLESRICEIRWLTRGATVGYGGAYRARNAIKIAVIPLGYSHGFATEKIRDSYRFRDGVRFVLQDIKRTLTHERLWVEIGDKRVPVLGHVGMLHTVVDITNLDCALGDAVRFDISPLYVSAAVLRKYI
ncbi:MAG: alanine racemase, partial [Clostridia bacterium]